MTSMARGKGEGGLSYDSTKKLWEASIELPPVWDDDAGKWRRRRRKVSSKDKKVAMQKYQAARREVERGNLASSSLTVQAWVDHWLAEIAPKKINPNTIKAYRSSLKHVTRRYGTKKLSQLTPQRIRELTSDLSKSKSASTARNLHSYLSHCLKDAVGDGVLPEHPMQHLPIPARRRTKEAALSTERTIELLQWLAARMDDQDEYWAPVAPIFIGYLLTGARRSELLGLRPEYISDTLDVAWQLRRLDAADVESTREDFELEHVAGNFYLTRPKYGSTRQYPLVEPLRSVMLAVRDSTPQGGLCFRRPDGAPWDPDGITYRWKRLMATMGWEIHHGPKDQQTPPEERVKLHGARHGLVDILWELGIPPEVIRDIVGHTSREMTEKYRTRISPEAKKALEKMSRRLTALEPH